MISLIDGCALMCAPWLCGRTVLLPAINMEIIKISFSKSSAVFGSRSNWRLLYLIGRCVAHPMITGGGLSRARAHFFDFERVDVAC